MYQHSDIRLISAITIITCF